MPSENSGAPLPLRIVFGIVFEVLPADFGLVTALDVGTAITVNKSDATNAMEIRTLFMEPPAPLVEIIKESVQWR